MVDLNNIFKISSNSAIESEREKEKFKKARQTKLAELRENAPPDEIDSAGNKYWLDSNGEIHRDYDLPAIVYIDGFLEWYSHGRKHRDGDKPAFESPNGVKEWWQNNQLHRESGPAMIFPDGEERWFKNGELHRDNGLPAVVEANGVKEWWQNGKRYGESGP